MKGHESAFRQAIQMGRDSKLPEALEVAAKAAFYLAANLYPDNESVCSEIMERIAEVMREAIELGKASGTTDGAVVARKAEEYLAVLQESKI